MSYLVEIVNLLRGHTDSLGGSGVDGRIISVTTDDEQVRDALTDVEGVATWEASREPDDTWLIYIAPAHGTTIFTLRDRVVSALAELA